MSASDNDRLMMETLYWWGVPTLFRAPFDPDPQHCDIALIGVPHSSGNGSTERDQHEPHRRPQTEVGKRSRRQSSSAPRAEHGERPAGQIRRQCLIGAEFEEHRFICQEMLQNAGLKGRALEVRGKCRRGYS